MPAEVSPSFSLLAETNTHSAREWGPPALGFAAAAGMTWLLLPGPRLPGLSLFSLWALAARCTVPVLVVTALVVWVTSRLLSRATAKARITTAIDVACLATWLPPLAILFRQGSPIAAVIAAVLALAIMRWVLTRYVPPGAPVSVDRNLPASLCAALALQAGVTAIAIGEWHSCAVAFAAAALVLTWIVSRAAVWPLAAPGGRAKWKFRIVPVMFLGVAFSAGGLSPLLAHGDGSGGNGANGDQSRPMGDTNAVVAGDSYPGVMLLPDTEDHITIVPPLPRRGRSLFNTAQVDSLTIPFFGAYWYFKGAGQFPQNPFITHGDPAKLSFRSTDFGPLSMEARQNLGHHIDLGCCTSVGVLIRNGDRDPGSVLMELLLRDTALRDTPSISLGLLHITTAPAQTVIFPLLASTRVRQFDEIAVRFHLLRPRVDRSARVAIRRFIFYR